ncbi:MAG: right-handed parallel beta-helix repeat-containing protein [Phycisphaeraceae bacterium]|nr:right-handed parallel beta-helix repeat-containing protein [Phycisphaeraceae bacterium]
MTGPRLEPLPARPWTRDAVHRAIATVALMLALASAVPAAATPTQHLVRPGQDWLRIAHRASPGDEILLMPGRHLGGTLEHVRGTEQRPISIRSADPRRPVEIETSLHGLRLRHCAHLRLERLQIAGARIAGIVLEGDPSDDPDRVMRDITLRDVTIQRTGPSGQRHGVIVRHGSQIRLEHITIEGWAGSAIEAIGVNALVVERALLRGLDGFSQQNGIRLRGGTSNVILRHITLVDCGEQGLVFGGASRPDEQRLTPDDTDALEAHDVEVENILIERVQAAFAFIHAGRVTIRNSTVVHPTRFVASIRREREEPEFGDPRDCLIARCIVVWKAGEITSLTHLGRRATVDGIALEENLWWEVPDGPGPMPGEVASARRRPTDWPGREVLPQLTTVDPDLGPDRRPRATAAEGFGARDVPAWE